MIYLLPIGGEVPEDFGVLTAPKRYGIPKGIPDGRWWAVDNGAFTGRLDIDKYLSYIKLLEPYKNKCLFVNIPDILGNAVGTIDYFHKYFKYFRDWPLAFVGQDGQENLEFPDIDVWDTFFLGGTTKFKDGEAGLSCTMRAIELGKKIHIGRVNEWKRYNKFAQLEKGYKYEFTCDGTKNRYIGVEKAIARFRNYRERTKY